MPPTFVTIFRESPIFAVDPMEGMDEVKLLWVLCWIPRKLVRSFRFESVLRVKHLSLPYS